MSCPHPLCLFSEVVSRVSFSGVPSHELHRNICGACAVTVVVFGHLNRSFLVLFALVGNALKMIIMNKSIKQQVTLHCISSCQIQFCTMFTFVFSISQHLEFIFYKRQHKSNTQTVTGTMNKNVEVMKLKSSDAVNIGGHDKITGGRIRMHTSMHCVGHTTHIFAGP